MFAAEATPYAKVGGLGDVVGALPRALEKLGLKLKVIIPAYTSSVSRRTLPAVRRLSNLDLDIAMAASVEQAEVFHSRMDQAAVDVYLIGSGKYFDRKGIYDDPDTKEGYPDNMERFIFFMKSGLSLIEKLAEPVDIIHCHDSHTALIPGILKTSLFRNRFFSRVGTLLTIHNLAHQGVYPTEALDYAGIAAEEYFPMSPFEYWGQVNFLKAGIAFADKINTVSRTYAVEIQTSAEYGFGLEGSLQNRKEDVSGIINGIDYSEWNPETDPLLPANFSVHDLAGKAKCKEYLLECFGMQRAETRIPLIGIVSRLVDQKGFDLIAEAIEEIVDLDLQMVILGMGQQKYHDLLRSFASRYRGKIGIRLSFDNELAHKIEGGCDMFLMPSRFEPCGLNQLYSLRYGTIPIVRKTGGLADTVSEFDGGMGTGFTFSEYSAAAMMKAIHKALAVFSDSSVWKSLRIRAMSQDWSWAKSALRYRELYERIMQERHSTFEGILKT
jgi:starch synthase